MIKTEKSIATMTDEQFATIEKHKLTPYLGRPDDIANAAVYLASDDSRFVTAQLLCVDGGITAHMPHVAEFRAAFEPDPDNREVRRSDEHTSELQSLMRNSYAVFGLKKQNYEY